MTEKDAAFYLEWIGDALCQPFDWGEMRSIEEQKEWLDERGYLYSPPFIEALRTVILDDTMSFREKADKYPQELFDDEEVAKDYWAYIWETCTKGEPWPLPELPKAKCAWRSKSKTREESRQIGVVIREMRRHGINVGSIKDYHKRMAFMRTMIERNADIETIKKEFNKLIEEN